jgi:hypothetical protein
MSLWVEIQLLFQRHPTKLQPHRDLLLPLAARLCRPILLRPIMLLLAGKRFRLVRPPLLTTRRYLLGLATWSLMDLRFRFLPRLPKRLLKRLPLC